MNNKEQIMIDDVDVSGCESIEHHSLNPITLANEFLSTPMCRAYQSKCEGRNCYFKQLARKTQELEQYKKSKQASYETMQREWNKATLENRKLKLERKGLKKQLDLYKTWYRAKHDDIRNLLGSYRKALDEIEGLVSKVDGADECSYGDFNCSNCDDDCTCPTKVKRLILDIINKAKGGNNE